MKMTKLNSGVYMYNEPVYKTNRPVMALSFDKEKSDGKYQGLIREIVKREGDVAIPGYLDRSRLFHIESSDGLKWERKEELNIDGIDDVIKKCNKGNMFFIGLEDPDIFVDKNMMHIYFTIAYKFTNRNGYLTYLGHAYGEGLDDLKATKPVLSPNIKTISEYAGFKEVGISPIKFSFGRICLAESGYWDKKEKDGVSTIVAAKAKNMAKPWKLIGKVADPKDMKSKWLQGHLSPGPILPRKFLSIDDYLVGIVNGRSPTINIDGKRVFGRFRIGLMLVNPRTGEIPWIMDRPLIDDPDARTVTFASDFNMINKNEGILYAHVDDSFVRAYKLDASELIGIVNSARKYI